MYRKCNSFWIKAQINLQRFFRRSKKRRIKKWILKEKKVEQVFSTLVNMRGNKKTDLAWTAVLEKSQLVLKSNFEKLYEIEGEKEETTRNHVKWEEFAFGVWWLVLKKSCHLIDKGLKSMN
jgi:phosphoribosyl-dephospho-CoA transferase